MSLSSSSSPVRCARRAERSDEVEAVDRNVRCFLAESSADEDETTEVSLARGLDLDRDLDLFLLGVLELEEGVGFVGVTIGEPERKRRFISSIACSVGCMLVRGLDLAPLGLSVRLS